MVKVMNQQKGKLEEDPKASSTKSHSKENAQITSKTASQKYRAHSGIRFKFDLKKVTTVHPFSFDTASRNGQKGTIKSLPEKSADNQADSEKKDPTDAEGRVKVLMETLKISENMVCSSEATSRKDISPKTKDYSRDKKECYRCLNGVKCLTHSKKEATPEAKSSKVVKSVECPREETQPKEKSPITPGKDYSRYKNECFRCLSGVKCLTHSKKETQPEAKSSKVVKSVESPRDETQPKEKSPITPGKDYSRYKNECFRCISGVKCLTHSKKETKPEAEPSKVVKSVECPREETHPKEKPPITSKKDYSRDKKECWRCLNGVKCLTHSKKEATPEAKSLKVVKSVECSREETYPKEKSPITSRKDYSRYKNECLRCLNGVKCLTHSRKEATPEAKALNEAKNTGQPLKTDKPGIQNIPKFATPRAQSSKITETQMKTYNVSNTVVESKVSLKNIERPADKSSTFAKPECAPEGTEYCSARLETSECATEQMYEYTKVESSKCMSQSSEILDYNASKEKLLNGNAAGCYLETVLEAKSEALDKAILDFHTLNGIRSEAELHDESNMTKPASKIPRIAHGSTQSIKTDIATNIEVNAVVH